MTTTALAAPDPDRDRRAMQDLERLADNLARSGYFKDARTATQAFAKMLFGRELGLTAMQSMTGLHIIEGSPSLAAGLRAARIKTYRGPEGETYDYKTLVETDEECRIQFFKNGEPLGDPVSWTIAEAAKNNLTNKANWKGYPSDMLFARCISRGMKRRCPEVEGVAVYDPDELDFTSSPTPIAPPPGTSDLAAGDVVDSTAIPVLDTVAPATEAQPGVGADGEQVWPEPPANMPDEVDTLREEAKTMLVQETHRSLTSRFRQLQRADNAHDPENAYKTIITLIGDRLANHQQLTAEQGNAA